MSDQNSKNTHKPTENQIIASDMLKMFYNRPSQLKDENGNEFTTPPEGNLGLLALGHIGLIEWRKARQKQQMNKQNNKEKE